MKNPSRLRLPRLPIAALIAAAAVLAAPGIAAAETLTFFPEGAEQTFVVPAGVTTVHAIAIGGRGGDGEGNVGGLGGFGAIASADLAVTPGQTLYVEVGGNGDDAADGGAGGFNGGGSSGEGSSPSGGGGGASDIRLAPSAAGTSLELRMIVAAGGGGAGSGNEGGFTELSIDGGTAGPSPTAGTSPGGSSGGEPGSATAGGEGGSGCAFPESAGAESGSLGSGGDGSGISGCIGSPISGAGGGGGVYGGGGGGASSQASGGGAGWSGFGSIATNGTLATDTTGKPSISITFGPGTASPILSPPPVAKCKVPNLRGRKLKAARKLLLKRGCKLGNVKRKSRKAKKVVAQKPKPGKTLPAGTKVNVTLGGGKANRR